MSPSVAPRRKSCQALLPDTETACSTSFRGWGKYCPEHLEECAKLTGRCKDAFARAERLRRIGELSERQVRALSSEAAATRAVDRVQQYLAALEEESSARTTLYARFPAEKDERHAHRVVLLEERRAASTALISQLQQHREEITTAVRQRRERHGPQPAADAGQGDLERRPLLGHAPRSPSQAGNRWWIVFLAFFFVVIALFAFTIWTGAYTTQLYH